MGHSRANSSQMPGADNNTSSTICINSLNYPLARKDQSIVDDFHGVKVADPYRWLEDPNSNETKDFVEQLNSISKPFIASSPYREKISKRLTELWDYEKFSSYSKRGDYYYHYYNSGLQNQSIIYRQKGLDDRAEVFLDPNKFSEDGTTAITLVSFTRDGSILAYGISEKGSDWVTLKFRRVDGTDLTDVVMGVKHSGLDWLIDNSGVFYSTYPEHKSSLVGSSTEKHEYHSLYYHKLGTPQSDDVLVAEFRSDSKYMWFAYGVVSKDGRYLLVEVSRGTDPNNMIYYCDMQEAGQKITGKLELKTLFDKLDARYEFVDNNEDKALILTNHDAPMFKLIRVKMSTANQGPSVWETVIPESNNKLEWVVNIGGDRLLVSYLEDVKNKLYVHSLETGERFYEIILETGTVSGVFGDKYHTEIFIRIDSFLTPGIVYYANFKDKKPEDEIVLKEYRRTAIKGVDTSKFAMKQVFYASKDATKVPMYIIHNKDLVLDGNNPVLLIGYGGFNIALMPHFFVSHILFLANFKGVVAVANLRGGSEYGAKWHEAGMREQKQNVFDDFIAAAEYLINNNYTSSNRLAIHGKSNGGLLVGVVSQQRPDLFGAVLNQVGVLDMLRYHKFTIGSAWVPEYGDPEDELDFKYIYKYSPLHNIEIPNKSYQWPPTMLLTADHDDRVVPSHSLKYIARLYEAAQGSSGFQKNPLIIRVDSKAGHGAGKPTSKIIAEITDKYSFLQKVLNLEWHD
ncbi:unnamed protein product [Thelazia callipaeda]|uniref:Prolyl endopeptidase n=1 Tax=Thelazia callipaeda TaxID=103827 RepID=A0A0N5CXG0_THECL|nr:unnamed protein product [Thelazia callipaeda]